MATAKDRISGLPTVILQKILAFLPIDDAARTSALSSRWRRLATTNPTLNFHFSSSDPETLDFVPMVDRFLILASANPKLKSILLPLRDGTDVAAALCRWIRFAADRHIEEITLKSLFSGGFRVEVPRVIFECRAVESIKMQNCLLRSVPVDGERFGRLKQLVLAYVDIENDGLNAMLSLCPRVETLALSNCRGLTRIVILSPTMKSLTVKCDRLDQFEVVWVPKLQRLMYDGDPSKVKSLEGLGNLEEAAILSTVIHSFENRQHWKKIISALAHVKILTVNSWFFEFPLREEPGFESEVVFNKLKEFHYWPVHKRGGGLWIATRFSEAHLRALVSALLRFPVIEQFCMHGNFYWEDDERFLHACMDEELYMQQRCGPRPRKKFDPARPLLPHLNKVKLILFSCKEEEIRLLKFVLSKAAALKSAVIYYVPEEQEKVGEVRRAIGSLRKASENVSVSLTEVPRDYCGKFDTMWWQFTDF